MDGSINWSQKRTVYRNSDGDFYVGLYGQKVMEISEYIEGGIAIHEVEAGPLTEVGVFTNAQIDAGEYDQ